MDVDSEEARRMIFGGNAPNGLSVSGSLDLTGCIRLTALPNGLSVGGNLYLAGCTGLTALPDGLSVGGNVVDFHNFLEEETTHDLR